MEFLNKELNNRIHIFGTEKYKKIISVKNPPCYKLIDLKKELLLGFVRFDIEEKSVKYECVFTSSKIKELYVFLSGAAPRQDDLRANFDRVSWHQYFNGCCINIEDPTYKTNKCKTGWGGYFGDKEKSYIDGVEAIVRKLQLLFEIPNCNVFFISSSAGGFASLHVCSRNDGYRCLVRNPQIFLGDRELSGAEWMKQLDVSSHIYKERLHLGDSIVRNKTSRFYMFFNRCSDWDMGNLRQLLAKFGVNDVSQNYYHFGNKHIVVMETNIQEPHNNHCCPFPATILTRMELYPPDDLEHMLFSLLKANQERCGLQDRISQKEKVIADLKKKLEEREENLRLTAIRDLWTARLDIKNCGNNNAVMVTNLLQSNPVNITHPDWFKNAEGQGVMVEGVSGIAKLSLFFKGNGVLKIDLRGITKWGPYQNRLPYWITFISFRVNDNEILKKPVDVWHDKPVTCSKNVQDGERMMLEIRWRPCHQGI